MQASTQTVWFAPLWQSPDYSSVDYFDLFSPSAPWSTAASHVQIFKIYSQLLEAVSDDQLQKLFADLDRRGIALALEFPPLVSENCGFVEGFGDAGAAFASGYTHSTKRWPPALHRHG